MKIEMDLVYLAILTGEGVKPLSRWEGIFSSRELGWLARYGLRYRTVERLDVSGRPIPEVVFSRDERYIERYVSAFEGKSLIKTPETIRLEGELFGYPSCCVEAFIENGYRPNGFDPKDQSLLFHWACPGCEKTAELLPLYRRAYRRARFESFKLKMRSAISHKLIGALAAGLMLTSLSLAVQGNPIPLPDPHWIEIRNDGDADGLKDSEESFFRMDRRNPDSDGDGIRDGGEVAAELLARLNSLPTQPSHNRTYRKDYFMKGIERCSTCGRLVNMGYIEVINPIKDKRLKIPYLALHYMEHGSLAYEGDLHTGRVDPVELALLIGEGTPVKPKGKLAEIWGRMKSSGR
jgi:hypothetical protein